MTDNTLLPKKPEQYRADVELKYNMSPTSLLNIILELKMKELNAYANTSKQTDEYSSFLDSEIYYINKIYYGLKKFRIRK
jgi:hypothetical protein